MLNERYVLDIDLASLNDALELCVYTFTSQLLMKVSQNIDNNKQLNEIAEIAKNMVIRTYHFMFGIIIRLFFFLEFTSL